MTPDEYALLQAVIASPDDDLPRLVYADWLDEHDRPERAEFIRCQCFLARTMGERDARLRRAACKARTRALAGHRRAWSRGLPRIRGVRWGAYVRGFVEVATVTTELTRTDSLAPLWTAAPIRTVRYVFQAARHLEQFLDWPDLGRVRTLHLYYQQYRLNDRSVSGARSLVRHPWPNRPETLDLRQFCLDSEGLAVLTTWPTGVEAPRIDLRGVWKSHPVIADVRKRFGDRCLT